MARQSSLRCRVCGNLPGSTTVQYCAECFGPLDVVPGPVGQSGAALRHQVGAGPRSMWRYRDLLPFDEPPGAAGVGWTPLVRAEALGAAVGLDELWLKDETANPSGSFKDRVVAAALGRALGDGARVLACASTGNLAHAVGGAARRAGLVAVVLVSAALPEADRAALAAVGATVVPVAGDYDAANRLASEASMDDACGRWAWVNIGLRPWYVEGSATLAHEIAEQLGWVVPDAVVVPIASGALALALHRAFADLASVGLVPPGPPPEVWGAQPEGCAPVADAFATGADDVAPVRPSTGVASLAMGDPPDGADLLAAARATGGGVVAVPEALVGEAQHRLLGTEAIAVEPAGGVVVAAVEALAADGRMGRHERVVACLTGGPHDRWPAQTVDAGGAMAPGRVTDTIPPTVSALSAVVSEGRSAAPEDPT